MSVSSNNPLPEDPQGPQRGASQAGTASHGTAATGGGAGGESSTSEAAKDQSRQVGEQAKGSGQQVAGAAKDEAANVASTASDQARHLLDETRSQLSEQAGNQQSRLAEGLRSISDELGSMAEGSQQSGMATDLVRQASERSRTAAGWLENNDPQGVLDEVKHFARRRPGAFLAIAAGAGLLAGRMTRGLSSGSGDGQSATGGGPATSRSGTTGLDQTGAAMIPQDDVAVGGGSVGAGAAGSPYIDPAATAPTGPPRPSGSQPDYLAEPGAGGVSGVTDERGEGLGGR